MAGFDTINKLYLPLKDMFRCNQKLLKYIAYDSDDPLSEPDIEDIDSLFDNRIWFRPKALSTITTKSTNVITTYKAIPTSNTQSYNDFLVTFVIISHNDLLLLADESKCFRTINIATEIDKYLNNAKGVFLGEVKCGGLLPMTDTSNSFSGYTLTYKVTDFHINYSNPNRLE